ncbi:GNAT family N-acetyltransferase [Azospirillum isscasi]|uniref:GNAT family N-acetyltransferase n=1 Tax=Azospirillum isscasi TaxID=3053926 RepID=A0ABU0WD34_9PROT|nr:GNAT family N-acetyltransferase [Azospirillum isscasi]MDQ2102095.1 GNAT family N-acetyltransferase [Azospirillum isscasi]
MTVCVEGFLESVGPWVTGWAWLPADPARRLRLSLLLDAGSGNVLRLDTLADRDRGDLQAAGKGDGRYGFALAVPDALAAREHDVDVRLHGFPDLRLSGAPRRAIPALGPVTLRAVHPESGDVERLHDLLAGMVRLQGGCVSAVPDAETIRSWLATPGRDGAERGWLVAERNGRLVGHCRIGPDWPAAPGSGGLALGIELHPDVHGHGLGHALMRAAEGWATGRGVRLDLAVLPHNARALALYRKLGYADLGAVVHPATGEIHRHMALPLPPRGAPRGGVILVL